MVGWLRALFARMFGGAGPEPDVWHFQIKGDRKEIGALNDALERAAAGRRCALERIELIDVHAVHVLDSSQPIVDETERLGIKRGL